MDLVNFMDKLISLSKVNVSEWPSELASLLNLIDDYVIHEVKMNFKLFTTEARNIMLQENIKYLDIYG